MSRRFMCGLVLALMTSTFQLVPASAGTKWAECSQHTDIERRFATMIQGARTAVGEEPMRLDQHLSRVAGRHTWEMDVENRLYKTAPRKLHRVITMEKILGENVGVGRSIESIHSALVQAPSYRANLRNGRYRHYGVGVRKEGDHYWVTTVFEASTNPGTRLKLCKSPTTDPDPSPSPSPDPEPSPSPTATPSPSPSPTATPSPSPSPTATPSPSPSPTATPSPSPSPTATPSPSPSPTPDPEPVSELSVTAPNSYSARISWTLPVGTTRVKIFREGRLIDDVVVTGALSYTDHLLWKLTAYNYEVKAFGPGGTLLASQTDRVTTKDQTAAFPRLYSDTSFWNTPIGSSPNIDPNSDAMVSRALTYYKSTAHLSNSDSWGIGLAYADPLSRLYSIGCTRYGCDRVVSARIPQYAAASSGSDGKLTVIEPSTHTEFDAWIAEYDPVNDSWRAGSRFLTSSTGWGALCGLGEHCNGPNAMGTAGMGGVVRPEEIAQGHIDHALAVATPYTRSGFIACPGTHTDGKYADTAAIPQGARIQMDPSFNVDATSWPRWKKVVAKAFQKYGAYIDDTGGSLSVSSESNVNRGYDAWTLAGVTGSKSLADFPWEKFRVLEMKSC